VHRLPLAANPACPASRLVTNVIHPSQTQRAPLVASRTEEERARRSRGIAAIAGCGTRHGLLLNLRYVPGQMLPNRCDRGNRTASGNVE